MPPRKRPRKSKRTHQPHVDEYAQKAQVSRQHRPNMASGSEKGGATEVDHYLGRVILGTEALFEELRERFSLLEILSSGGRLVVVMQQYRHLYAKIPTEQALDMLERRRQRIPSAGDCMTINTAELAVDERSGSKDYALRVKLSSGEEASGALAKEYREIRGRRTNDPFKPYIRVVESTDRGRIEGARQLVVASGIVNSSVELAPLSIHTVPTKQP